MRIFDVSVLSYDDGNDSYLVQYHIEKKAGVVRRSKAQYKDGVLSRDDDKAVLKRIVADQVKYFNYSH